MAASMMNRIEIGFVEKSPKWRLISQYFPSKIGGKPAWLNLKEIPGSSDLSCPICGKTMAFLLEVYCPPGEEHGMHDEPLCLALEERASCFHRSVYIFCCREPSCHQTERNPFIVLRCQLPRINAFFSHEPPDEEREVPDQDIISPQKFGVNLCDVCGCNARTKKCGRCNVAAYCSKDHQVLDWKEGHKKLCGKEQGAKLDVSKTKFLFPEYELVTEEEENEEQTDIETEGQDEEAAIGEDAAAGNLLEGLKGKNYEDKDLESMAKTETEDDKQFMTFKQRIARDPDQVLRYQKGGEPLYVSASQQPREEDIPPCRCGAKRQFEFQVLPQLLTHLDVDSLGDSIDWGTLLVYTCYKSCLEGPAYHPEFLWKQDYQNSSI